MIKYLIGILTLTTLLAVSQFLTCPCPNPAPALLTQYTKANLIFEGTVLNIDLSETDNNLNIRMNITKVWKGNHPLGQIEVVTCNRRTCCGFSFKKGQKYVVFVEVEEGLFKTGTCSGTQLYSTEFAKKLRELPVTNV
jgi:hypothetical protein